MKRLYYGEFFSRIVQLHHHVVLLRHILKTPLHTLKIVDET